MAPVPARNVIHGVLASSPPCAKYATATNCATVPTTISVSAVEILNQIASSVAASANPTHNAASAHVLIMNANS